MSDSVPSSQSSSSSASSDATLAAALRDTVERIFNAGDLSSLTLKRVRSAAEKQLKLPEGFFKEHTEWKGKSKEIIEAEADALFAGKEAENDSLSSSPAKKPVVPKKGAIVKSKAEPPKKPVVPKKGATVKSKAEPPKKPAKADDAKRGIKRSSPVAEPKTKKRQKKDTVSMPDLGELLTSDNDGEAPKKKSRKAKPTKKQDGDGRGSNIELKKQIVDKEAEEDKEDAPKKGSHARRRAKAQSEGGDDAKTLSTAKHDKGTSNIYTEDGSLSAASHALQSDGDAGNASESEMSIVIDEEPAPKTKRKKRPSDVTSPKKVRSSKAKSSAVGPKDDGTPEAEIKRLQSWLLKCGIRKVWSKELAPYSTPKSKITHLKQMLKDAGMEGRFSAEKARQIKEDRELKAELEAVQDGARRWGEGAAEEDEDNSPKPRRRLAKGLRELDFLGSDGEETE